MLPVVALRPHRGAARGDQEVLEGLGFSLGGLVVADGLARLPGRGGEPAAAGEPVVAAGLRDIRGRDHLGYARFGLISTVMGGIGL